MYFAIKNTPHFHIKLWLCGTTYAYYEVIVDIAHFKPICTLQQVSGQLPTQKIPNGATFNMSIANSNRVNCQLF